MNTTQHVVVDGADAIELIEVFEFLCDWFDRDHTIVEHSLARFTPQMSLSALQHDLRRYADQLGRARLVTTSNNQEKARP